MVLSASPGVTFPLRLRPLACFCVDLKNQLTCSEIFALTWAFMSEVPTLIFSVDVTSRFVRLWRCVGSRKYTADYLQLDANKQIVRSEVSHAFEIHAKYVRFGDAIVWHTRIPCIRAEDSVVKVFREFLLSKAIYKNTALVSSVFLEDATVVDISDETKQSFFQSPSAYSYQSGSSASSKSIPAASFSSAPLARSINASSSVSSSSSSSSSASSSTVATPIQIASRQFFEWNYPFFIFQASQTSRDFLVRFLDSLKKACGSATELREPGNKRKRIE